MPLTNFYSAVPALVKDFLQTHPDIFPVPMVTLSTRDLAEEFNMALGGVLAGPTGKVGISLVISATAAGEPLPNAPVAFNLANALELTAFDFPMINHDATRSDSLRITGPDLLSSCIATLKKFSTLETAFAGINFYEGRPPMDFPEVRPDDGLVIYRGRLLFAGGVEETSAVVATPVITRPTEDDATITCATAGAAIYYTTDGARPIFFGAGNVNNVGTLYTVALTGLDNATLKARAFKTALRGSLIATSNPL